MSTRLVFLFLFFWTFVQEGVGLKKSEENQCRDAETGSELEESLRGVNGTASESGARSFFFGFTIEMFLVTHH